MRNFRDFLEVLEDRFDWFSHKGSTGRQRFQDVSYFETSNEDLRNRSLQFRYRRDVGGAKDNATDFTVKFKSGGENFAKQPMTAASSWEDFWSCKTESNLKYLPCPREVCYPGEACSTPCPGQNIDPGLGLEAVEQASKIKSKGTETFAQNYSSPNQFTHLTNITSLFPHIAQHFLLGALETRLLVSRTQFRYVYDDISIKFEGEKVKASFTLFYTDAAEMSAGNAPSRGEWSFKLKEGTAAWGKAALAKSLIETIGQEHTQC